MNLSDLKQVGDLAKNVGVKALIYGAPGSGKSPVSLSAPKPLILITEPGTLSLRGSNIPAYEAYSSQKIDEFFLWWFKSNETKQFDTLVLDSVSQMCETFLQDELNGTSKGGNKKHGLQAYGSMAESVMTHLRPLFFMPEKHCYLICKQMTEDGVKKPYFPGQKLLVEIPHLYDAILHLGIHNVPGMGQVSSFQCRQTIDIVARDRSGRLAEFEPPDFGLIIKKAMS